MASYAELTRRFASGNGAIFVGAGLSMASGLPSWKELVAPLRATMTDLPNDQEFTPEQIAGWYEIDAGRPALVEHLRNTLIDATPSPCHRLLAGLPVDLFLTTNFDNLLEQSLDHPDVIVNDVDFSALDDPTKRQLIKIHGDFRDAASIVFTKSDYDHYLENRPAIAETIRLTLMRRTVLFIGYSFNDRNLTAILSQVGRRLGEMQRPLFTVLLNPNTYAVRELEQKYGACVVSLEVGARQDPSKVVHDWLESFRNDIEREQVAYMARRGAQPISTLPAHGNAFIGRQQDIDDVTAALQTFRIVGVQGFPGSGKTALAIEVARRCEYGRKAELNSGDLLFAHCLYVNARGTRAAEPLIHQILDKAADLFRLAAIRQLDISQLDKKKEQINAVLKIFRVLIIIDQLNGNIAKELSSWLETIPAPSSVLLVSRMNLENVNMLVSIREMEELDAKESVRARLAEHRLKLDDAQVSQLIDMVNGNPQGLKLLVGQMATGRPTSLDKADDIGQYDASTVLDDSWELLTEGGKKILLAASIFATNAIPEDALHAASGIADHEDFLAGLKECQNLLLLEFCTEPKPVSQCVDGYSLHPMTITRARQFLEADTEAASGLYRRLGHYYLGWIRDRVVRRAPDVAYWNALATPNMLDIDDEWPTIRRMVYWMAGHDHNAFVDMVFLLVHYLDTRLYNSDRQHLVKAAIPILKKQGRVADEALLHIDALSWTLMEEDKPAEAKQEILHGLDLVNQLDVAERAELTALAHAWLARIECEQGHMQKARELIDQASSDLGALRAWISYRVHMVAGDIHVKRADYAPAINSYKECLRLVASYGGEEGYQILPRIGLTYCLVSGGLTDARRIFSDLMNLSQSDNIEIGNLYAKYGLAVIDFKLNKACSSGAVNWIQRLRAHVAQSTSSSFMLWLMDQVYP